MNWTITAFILPCALAIVLPAGGYGARAGVLFFVAGVVEVLASRAWAQIEHRRFMTGDPVLSAEQAIRLLRNLYLLMGIGFVLAGAYLWRFGSALVLR